MSSSTIRVRQILSNMNTLERSALKKLLPPKLKAPNVETERYPSALLGCFPKEEAYAYLGHVAEEVLRFPSNEITIDILLEAALAHYPEFTDEHEAKVRKSKTTEPFLEALRVTRRALEAVLRPASTEGPLRFEESIVNGSVEGHPDMSNRTQVFEVKLTGLMKDNWTDFLLQLFAYGAIMPSATDLYLVMPLQKTVWHCDIRSWGKRAAFLAALTSWSTREQTTGAENDAKANALVLQYRIGTHVGKEKLLANTVASLRDYSKPYQIFLSGPQNSKFNVDDTDVGNALALIRKENAKIYVHSQYIINLCAKEATDDWHVKLLSKNLKVCRAMGGKGVVVHVGKSTDQPLPEALQKMRAGIQAVLEDATPECPLLLETPAGQGTETLKDMKEFIEFVMSFHDNRVRICLDTCHVFACGHEPVGYIAETLKHAGLLQLIHFNDSLGECGSCVDRHAFIGRGKIGFEKMSEIANVCHQHALPMVIE